MSGGGMRAGRGHWCGNVYRLVSSAAATRMRPVLVRVSGRIAASDRVPQSVGYRPWRVGTPTARTGTAERLWPGSGSEGQDFAARKLNRTLAPALPAVESLVNASHGQDGCLGSLLCAKERSGCLWRRECACPILPLVSTPIHVQRNDSSRRRQFTGAVAYELATTHR